MWFFEDVCTYAAGFLSSAFGDLLSSPSEKSIHLGLLLVSEVSYRDKILTDIRIHHAPDCAITCFKSKLQT
jgi:hypothetical protein